MGILLGLLTALTWGGADFIARFATHRIGTLRSMLYMQLIGFVTLTISLPLLGGWGISRTAPDGSLGPGVFWLDFSTPWLGSGSTARLRLEKWPWWRRSRPAIRL